MAKAQRLTETMIDKAGLPPQQKQEILWDSAVRGLGLRILPRSKTFWFQYRPGGGSHSFASRMIRIGAYPAIKLASARRAARDLAGKIARGGDPAAEKQEERRRASSTLRTLLAVDGEYERSLKRRRMVKTKMVMSSLRRGLGKLMSKDVAAVTRKDFVTAVTALEDKGLPGAAAGLRKFARTFCEWAVHRGYVNANVMAGYREPKRSKAEMLAAEARKARALSGEEIVALWNACEGGGVFGNILRLLLLTGTRRNEIATLTRDQVLSDRLVLPPSHTKTGAKHEIPLTPLMRTVITAQPKTVNPLIFPGERLGRAISGWTLGLNAIRRASGVSFAPHDLRRTCRTLMSRLGVAENIAELAIGHQRTGLVRLYNFDEAWELRCAAFAKVSDHVEKLLGRASAEGKVVAIPARR
jgi:integrase